MKIRSASADELCLGASFEHDDGRLSKWRYAAVKAVYRTALEVLRWLLG
jgi:hypothetical protein